MDKELHYDFIKVGKTTIEKNKRLEEQSKQYLQEYYQKLNDEKKAEEEKKLNEALSNARFGYASTYTRSKNRVNSLKEEIRYTNSSTTVAMTEMVAQVVEKSLLLDEAEYTALNPNYKTEIREIVRGLLENANITENITKEETLAIMEHIAATLPDVKTGKYLTEDQVADLVKLDKPSVVEDAINSLSGNVSKRVANLVEAEKKKVEEIEKDVEKTIGGSGRKEKAPAEEMPVEEVPAEEVVEEPVEGEAPAEEMPVEGAEDEQAMAGKTIHIDPTGATSISMPNGALSLNPDGSMDIQLMESVIDSILTEGEKDVDKVFKDATRDSAHGIRNGMKALSANMILGIVLAPFSYGATIPEVVASGVARNKLLKTRLAQREQDLIEFVKDKPEVQELIAQIKASNDKREIKALMGHLKIMLKKYYPEMEAAKKQLKENILVRETPRCGLLESLAVNEAQNMIAEGKEYNADLAIANAITYMTIIEAVDELGLIKVDRNTYANIVNNAGGLVEAKCADKVEKNNNGTKRLEKTGKSLNESVICSQQAPILNKSNPTDLAERIRQRRLSENSNNGIINE